LNPDAPISSQEKEVSTLTGRYRKISPMEISTSSEISGASEEASGMSDSLEGEWLKVEDNANVGEDLETLSRNVSEAMDELNNLAESTAAAPIGTRSETSDKERRPLKDRH